MNKKIALLASVLLTSAISCKHEKKEIFSHNIEHKNEKHWSYSGETSPEHWIEIEKNSDCNGKYQ